MRLLPTDLTKRGSCWSTPNGKLEKRQRRHASGVTALAGSRLISLDSLQSIADPPVGSLWLPPRPWRTRGCPIRQRKLIYYIVDHEIYQPLTTLPFFNGQGGKHPVHAIPARTDAPYSPALSYSRSVTSAGTAVLIFAVLFPFTTSSPTRHGCQLSTITLNRCTKHQYTRLAECAH